MQWHRPNAKIFKNFNALLVIRNYKIFFPDVGMLTSNTFTDLVARCLITSIPLLRHINLLILCFSSWILEINKSHEAWPAITHFKISNKFVKNSFKHWISKIKDQQQSLWINKIRKIKFWISNANSVILTRCERLRIKDANERGNL